MHHVESWPFQDPEELATFTVDDVLSGAKPILRVSHNISDGLWQFLPGEPINLAEAKYVCLQDMVACDHGLVELADLPLGWTAVRAAVGKGWIRTPNFPTEWDELVSAANAYTETQQSRLETEFSLLDWKRYDVNQEAVALVFSSEGSPRRLVTRIQIVGSTSKRSGRWLWAWGNISVLEQACGSVPLLRKFGLQHRFERLSEATWNADEVDGWEMAAIACLLLGGKGVYRAPYENGALFMVLTNPEIVQVA